MGWGAEGASLSKNGHVIVIFFAAGGWADARLDAAFEASDLDLVVPEPVDPHPESFHREIECGYVVVQRVPCKISRSGQLV